MARKNEDRKAVENKGLAFEDIGVLHIRAVGKDKGISLVYGNISYPQINKVHENDSWFNNYFKKLYQNCVDFISGELTNKARDIYEKSQNPKKRFYPRIYNYILECMLDRGKTENIIYITFTAKLFFAHNNLLLSENVKTVIVDLCKMRIIK